MFFALWRHLDDKAACIFEKGTVVEKRGPLKFLLRKVLIPSRQQQLSQRFQKNAKQYFSCQHHQERPKKCQTMTYMPSNIFYAKPLFKMPNFWNLALKMPTWPAWVSSTFFDRLKIVSLYKLWYHKGLVKVKVELTNFSR